MTSTKNGTMSDLCQELGKLFGVPICVQVISLVECLKLTAARRN